MLFGVDVSPDPEGAPLGTVVALLVPVPQSSGEHILSLAPILPWSSVPARLEEEIRQPLKVNSSVSKVNLFGLGPEGANVAQTPLSLSLFLPATAGAVDL